MSRADAGLAPLFGLEAVTVVANVDLERVLVLEERESHFVGCRVLLHVVQGFDCDAIQRRLGLARERPRIVERFLEGPPRLAGHLTCRGGYGGDEAEVVEGRRANGAEDLACLADGAPQKLARLSDLN